MALSPRSQGGGGASRLPRLRWGEQRRQPLVRTLRLHFRRRGTRRSPRSRSRSRSTRVRCRRHALGTHSAVRRKQHSPVPSFPPSLQKQTNSKRQLHDTVVVGDARPHEQPAKKMPAEKNLHPISVHRKSCMHSFIFAVACRKVGKPRASHRRCTVRYHSRVTTRS